MPHATHLATDRSPALSRLGYPLLLGILLTSPLAQAGGAHGQHTAQMGHPADAAQATRTIEHIAYHQSCCAADGVEVGR